jgi:hypothetical protein
MQILTNMANGYFKMIWNTFKLYFMFKNYISLKAIINNWNFVKIFFGQFAFSGPNNNSVEHFSAKSDNTVLSQKEMRRNLLWSKYFGKYIWYLLVQPSKPANSQSWRRPIVAFGQSIKIFQFYDDWQNIHFFLRV